MKRLTSMLVLAMALVAASPVALAAKHRRASPAKQLIGTWTTVISKGPGVPPHFDTTWKVQFMVASPNNPNMCGVKNCYVFEQNGTNTLDQGKYTVSGSTITFTDKWNGGISCSSTGRYRFKLTGKKLKFTTISDSDNSCYGRKLVLTRNAFTKG